MNLEPRLHLHASTTLALSPQMAQALKLLTLSAVELQQTLEEALQANPLLEVAETDEESPEETLPITTNEGDESDDWQAQLLERPSAESPGEAHEHTEDALQSAPEEQTSANDTEAFDDELLWQDARPARDDDEASDFTEWHAATTDLHHYLHEQAALTPLAERDRALVAFMIEALDDDGYLHEDLDELLASIPPELEVGREDLETALKLIQSFDPPGVGARDLGECLRLQLRERPDTPARRLAERLASEALELLARKDYAAIKRRYGCDDALLREALALIAALDPHPGSRIGGEPPPYVIPDVIVRRRDGRWQAELNPAVAPRLTLNQRYAQILGERREGTEALRERLAEAKNLIRQLEQRGRTILRVAQEIVERQQDFFEHGEAAMKPLTLRTLAEALGLHESTISRVTQGKYLQCPRGVFEFRHFFGGGIAGEDGEIASATAIKARLRALIERENRTKPLSDARLAELLAAEGIPIARRTVAKYREQMQIPPASRRKAL
jgi:RNA polymerase sigma-54 factor